MQIFFSLILVFLYSSIADTLCRAFFYINYMHINQEHRSSRQEKSILRLLLIS